MQVQTLDGKKARKPLKLRFIEHLKETFTSSSGPTPQFIQFCNLFRRDFKLYLEQRFQATKIDVHRGHFELSGFFTVPEYHGDEHPGYSECIMPEQIWYFSIGDIRWNKQTMLLRTAKDYKDYTGGRNQEVSLASSERFDDEMESKLHIHAH